MPSLDELEHDSNEDAAKPVKGKATPEDPQNEGDTKGERRAARKQLHGHPEDKPWLDVDNPAIWTGDVDDEE